MRPRSGPTAPPDPLSSIIALLHPRTVQAKLISGSGTWSIRYARYEDPAFGLMLQGSCSLDAGEAGRLDLRQGDFILLPETPAFTLASDLAIKPRQVEASYAREVRHGDEAGPAEMRMLGGYFRFDRDNARLLVRLLPPIVHVRRDDPGAERLRRLVELIAEEADAERAGRPLILERLVEVLLIEALRHHAGTVPGDHDLLTGLADPALARALRAIHSDPVRSWTVAELARTAYLSRAVFAERFARKVGMPPMQYLLEWRIALAKELLRHERPPLAEVAERVGYASASAFSTAFSRLTGSSPSDFARSAN